MMLKMIRLQNLRKRLRSAIRLSPVEPGILALIQEIEKITDDLLADRESDG